MKKKDQWEEEAKDHFVAALKNEGRGDWVVSNTDVVVDEKINLNFDYQLQCGTDFIALEVFRLVETKGEIERQRSWNLISNSIAAELRRREVKGFTILTPNAFNVPQNKIEKFVSKIADNLQNAIEQNPGVDPIRESGFEIKRIEDFPDVSLYTVGPGGAVNPTGMAFSFLGRKLPKKNRQLAIANHERIVLIVNWLPLVDPPNMIEACSQIDFSQFQNVDKVYFEIPYAKPNRFHLVYDRAVYDAFREDGAPPKRIEPLFISWLANHLNRKHPRAFPLIRQITEREDTLMWLPALSREQLIPLGEDFVKQGNTEELYWIIDRLKTDPDPPVENRPDDPEGGFNDHLRIKNGKDTRILRSVRGRLCWLLMQVVTQPRLDDYERVFELVRNLATEENLYVRQQATVPLIELARRRLTKTEAGGRFMSDQLAADTKGLALRMIDENRQYPIVLEWIAHVMGWIRDLDHDAALKAVERFLVIDESDAADDISWMAIYFSLFRADQFKHLDPFDPRPMQKLLLDRLTSGAGRFRALATKHFKGLLERNEIQFETVIPYLEAVTSGKTDRVVNHHLYGIAATQAANYPEIVGRLIEQTVLAELKASDHRREVWYPKDFASALHALENAGPEHKERVAELRRQMEPYKHRIVNLYDF